MKITGTQAPRAPARTRGVKKTGAADSAQAPQSAGVVDKVSLAGIPENELTPRVRQAILSLFEEVSQLRAELAEARKKMGELKELAETDPLLGIMNRRTFVQELTRILAMVQRYETPASLVYIDLNDLKKINDGFGHAAGDAALAHVAGILRHNIRQTDFLGRLGGDEFGLILMVADEKTAMVKADQLQAAVNTAPIEIGGAMRRLNISCGVVGLPKSATAEEALIAADERMYAHKKRHKAERAERARQQRTKAS